MTYMDGRSGVLRFAKSFVIVLLLTTACGKLGFEATLDPESKLGPLTGDWAGWCCSNILDAGASWYVRLTEDRSGKLTGTVDKSHVWGPAVMPILSHGEVTGRRNGSRVSLRFRYERGGGTDGFTGEVTSAETFEGGMASWREATTSFERRPQGFGSRWGTLTGEWTGWCCDGERREGHTWHVDLTEDSSGDLTGSVEEVRVPGPGLPAAVLSGTVTGRQFADKVALYLAYQDGRRDVLNGLLIGETELRANMTGFDFLSMIVFERDSVGS